MKRIFAIVFACAGFCLHTFAQSIPVFEYGFNAGVNGASVSDGTNNNAGIKIGFNAGVSGEYYFSEKWGIKGKVIYDQKGWKNGYLQFAGSPVITTSYKLDYVTIPVMADLHLGPEGNRHFYVNFGPWIGILLNAKAASYDVKSSFNSVDGGIAVGLGGMFDIADNAKFFVETDNQFGVTNIFKTSASSNTVISSRLALNVGLLFSIY